MKKSLFTFLLLFVLTLFNSTAYSQQMTSWEIKWNFYGIRHEGLMILSGNVGTFRVKCIDRNSKELVDVVDQYVKRSYVWDGVILNCYNPTSHVGSDYSADNFKIFNNGIMYMMDNDGNWSNEIVMRQIIDMNDLLRMKDKYGL